MAADSFITWAEQGNHPEVKVWRCGQAVAVGSPGLVGRDRLAVAGPLDEVAALVETALAQAGRTYRPIGAAALIDGLLDRVPELVPNERAFGWMETTLPPEPDLSASCEWLEACDHDEIAQVLAAALPKSHARPGRAGVLRWAGVRDDSGAVLAIAAEAWSAPGVGFVSGVATRPDARGRGLAEAVCRFLMHDVVLRRGRVALMVERDNEPAIRLYRRLGLSWHDFAAARVP